MGRIQTLDYNIPDSMQKSWQEIVNLLAQIGEVPTTLIMRAHQDYLEVNTSSHTQGNPYKPGDKESLGTGLYCEYVINNQQGLIVSNAPEEDAWSNNPDLKLGMISYSGLPLLWPNGEVFGTLCMLDSKPNTFGETYLQLLSSFKDSIEAQLAVVFQQHKLLRLNHELQNRVENRTTDLAQLSYSLTKEIGRRKAAEKQVSYQKTHDQGTGFLNRSALEDVVEKSLKSLEDDLQSIIVINIGFSNARSIQTRYGFEAFDEILKEFHSRLVNRVSSFITGRPSSNDLVLLIAGDDVDINLDQLLEEINNVSVGHFYNDGTEVHLHSYIGVVKAHRNSNAKQLLQNACYAMLLCKESGEAYRYFNESHSNELNNHSQLEGYLLQAVRNDDLMLYFQPKVDPSSHKWIGAEALLRWRHPVLGDVSNEPLIRMAEQNGLIFEVGLFVLRTAIAKAKQWSELTDDFKIAVNVSPIQLQNVNFAEQVEHLLEAFHLPAHFIELEVTESALIADETIAVTTLNKLHQLGLTLSLDDFGTGFASFSYLKKYPFHAIKVDKSFVQQMEKSENDRAIIRSIIHIAKKLDLQVVVEGVESTHQEQFLIEEGCDIVQGFLYGKPMPCNEFEQGLLNQRPLDEQHTFPSEFVPK
ncbi:GGDEF and EAL domain-containing protein [Vibrio sp. EA2]|uniref:sensor domain-containing phosphodiesterase n=1 Tax=Vibrio sp. EA2 TaxID=3079860 RepID=UPI002948C645|nr:GGDEF and EAL domain-containing protein [Vibrio sp. EA2]MDV6250182.1 GGDEF and EAL domain-containing protein [Vibrio sp. EA2]